MNNDTKLQSFTHNDIAEICREILQENGFDPSEWPLRIYAFAFTESSFPPHSLHSVKSNWIRFMKECEGEMK